MIQKHPRDHATHQDHGNVSQGADAPVKQRHQQQRKNCGDNAHAHWRQAGQEVVEIVRKADAAAGHREWRRKHDLPNHQEREPASRAARSVGFAKIVVTPTRLGHRRAQFRPDQAVAERQQRSHQPAQHRLGPAHRGQEEGNGDVGTDPHHVRDGQRGGLDQP